MLQLSILVFFVSFVQGIWFNDPCDVSPVVQGIPADPDFTVDAHVPDQCRNGTFRWDYPRGHVILHFSNPKHLATTVCFADSLGGDVFTITDVTTHNERLLGNVQMDSVALLCSAGSHVTDIVMKIDAPEEQRYMGAVEYTIRHVRV